MKRTGLQRMVLSALGLILAGVVGGFAVALQQTHRELQRFESKVSGYEAQLEQLKTDIRLKEVYLSKLEADPAFLERVVRERLGYARPDDLLYRFPEDR